MTKQRKVYFLLQTVKDQNGNYIPCIAVEGEKGYYKTNWEWGDDWNIASMICNRMNENLGFSREEVMEVIYSTMLKE